MIRILYAQNYFFRILRRSSLFLFQTVLSLAVLLFCSIVNIVSMIIKQRNSSTHLNIRKSRAGESLGDSKRRDSNERLTEESKCKLLGRKDDSGIDEGDYRSINNRCSNNDNSGNSKYII